MIANRVRHFIAVAKAGGFGRAAAELGISQAPLSQSVQRLERDLGVALFDRHAKGVTLTDAGRAYLPDAEIAVAASERARIMAQSQSDASRAVRLGVITPALWGALPSLLAAARHADVRIELVEGTTDELREGLLNGKLDLSFLAAPLAKAERLTVVDLEREPVMALLPDRDGLRDLETADLAQMARALILFPRHYGPRLYDSTLALFVDRGLEPTIVFESPRMLTTLALVSAGIGSSIISPSLARSAAIAGTLCVPFDEDLPVPSWPVSLAYIPPAGRSPTARLLAHWNRTRMAPAD
ncbi:LysR family transcriptional regulator [Sphingomonas sp. ASV193]|uniref:LysR family transcriptional regulator n=1 Tax=Sphingomonas sp. ASV193 TaxID=3144405 RepID=UPI0032E889E1